MYLILLSMMALFILKHSRLGINRHATNYIFALKLYKMQVPYLFSVCVLPKTVYSEQLI